MKKQVKIVLNLECDTDQPMASIEAVVRDALAQFVHRGLAFATLWTDDGTELGRQDDVIVARYEVK
jgi:hypothetical protein